LNAVGYAGWLKVERLKAEEFGWKLKRRDGE
jgi:hypothetical protein